MKLIIILIICLGGISAQAEESPAWLKNSLLKCVDIFSVKPVKFHQGRAQSDQWLRSGSTFEGRVTMTGFVDAQQKHSINQFRTVIIGTLDYTVTGNQVTLTGMRHRSEYDGQGVFSTMLASIISQNQKVDTVVGTLNGENYVKFQSEIESNGGNLRLAMASTRVGKELAEMGFKEVLWVEEINYANSGNFVIPQFYRYGIKRQLP